MTKAIEEAAREAVRKEYLCESCPYEDDCDFCGGENAAFDCCECPADSYEDGFKAGANHIMSLPLSDRLTDKEKAVIKKAYAGMRSYGKSQSSECNKCANYVAEVWMNRIFSKEFAKNEAEELLDKLNEK